MEKNYIIIGGNNFVYSKFSTSSTKQIDIEIEEARMIIGERNEEMPTELKLLETINVKTVNV